MHNEIEGRLLMPMRAFPPRLYFLLLRKQGYGLATGSQTQAPFYVLDALARKAERPSCKTTFLVPALQGYDLPLLEWLRTSICYRPAELSVEDGFPAPKKVL